MWTCNFKCKLVKYELTANTGQIINLLHLDTVATTFEINDIQRDTNKKNSVIKFNNGLDVSWNILTPDFQLMIILKVGFWSLSNENGTSEVVKSNLNSYVQHFLYHNFKDESC